jgi:hypothetical protein
MTRAREAHCPSRHTAQARDERCSRKALEKMMKGISEWKRTAKQEEKLVYIYTPTLHPSDTQYQLPTFDTEMTIKR